jgi:hypothetical protein
MIAFIDDHRAVYEVEPICRSILGRSMIQPAAGRFHTNSGPVGTFRGAYRRRGKLLRPQLLVFKDRSDGGTETPHRPRATNRGVQFRTACADQLGRAVFEKPRQPLTSSTKG